MTKAKIRDTVKKKSDISLLFREGKRIPSSRLILVFRENGLEKSRFLFCADRSHKNSVQVNKTKRVLRACLLAVDFVPLGFDIAFVAKKSYVEIDYPRRVEIMTSLLRRIRK